MARKTLSAPDFRVQNDGSSFLLHANTKQPETGSRNTSPETPWRGMAT